MSYLGLNREELDLLMNSVNDFYTQFTKPKLTKRGKPQIVNGRQTTRTICPSFGDLKIIQKKVNQMFNRDLKYPEYYYGGIKGKDNIRNAKHHQGNCYFFVTDLENFFPSVSCGMVYKALVKAGYSADVSHIITRLYTFNGAVPQGTPTSMALANLATLDMTKAIWAICKQGKMKFTVYVDDLTISSQLDFKNLCPKITEIIRRYGFKSNCKKTYYKRGKQNVTGITVRQNRIAAPCSILYKISNAKKTQTVDCLNAYRKRIK